MGKYVATQDMPPKIRAGDVVNFKDELTDSFKPYFRPFNSDTDEEGEETHLTAGDNDHPVTTGLVNPDRNQLKAKARDLGINFAENIPTVAPTQLIQDAAAQRQTSDGDQDEE